MPMVAVSCTDRLLSMSRVTNPRPDSHSKQVSSRMWIFFVGVGPLTLNLFRMLGWYEYFYAAPSRHDRANIHSRSALVFAIQSWLAETPAKRAKSPTPGYFTVLMGCELNFDRCNHPIANDDNLVMSLAVVR